MTVFWIIIAVLLFILEAITVQLVSIWFAVGAVLATFPALFGWEFPIQMAVFVAGSIVTLLIGRPIIRKKLTIQKPEKTNLDATVGKTAVVTKPIGVEVDTGRIYVDGLSWQAKSKEGIPIEEGQKVTIEEIVGVTAIVSMVSE